MQKEKGKRMRLSLEETKLIESRRVNQENRILVIGDTHAPFMRDGYVDFLNDVYNKYQCNQVIHIGDLIDNHYSSYHETDPDGMSAIGELEAAFKQISQLVEAFPEMRITGGNHDNIPDRKTFSAGLSNRWVKSIKEILLEEGLPVQDWIFAEDFIIDNVLYTHGVGRKADRRALKDMISVVQGHYHSESYIRHYVGKDKRLWAMQVGCGINDKAYAFAYGKHFDKSHINCGVVLEDGTLPILEYMKL